MREAKGHHEANWEKAKLCFVDLEGVNFSRTNMKGADFECANLTNADLSGTDLLGANLRGARLQGAQFRTFDGLRFAYTGPTPPDISDLRDEDIARKTNLIGATLPDGTVFTEEMDYAYLRRFTDPYDPSFEAMLAWLDAWCNRP